MYIWYRYNNVQFTYSSKTRYPKIGLYRLLEPINRLSAMSQNTIQISKLILQSKNNNLYNIEKSIIFNLLLIFLGLYYNTFSTQMLAWENHWTTALSCLKRHAKSCVDLSIYLRFDNDIEENTGLSDATWSQIWIGKYCSLEFESTLIIVRIQCSSGCLKGFLSRK